jgi:hypothetical protein
MAILLLAGPTFASLALAMNAQGDCRIDIKPLFGDILTAAKTIAVITFGKPAQRRCQYGKPCAAAVFTRQIHGLLLHRIHAGQAAN